MEKLTEFVSKSFDRAAAEESAVLPPQPVKEESEEDEDCVEEEEEQQQQPVDMRTAVAPDSSSPVTKSADVEGRLACAYLSRSCSNTTLKPPENVIVWPQSREICESHLSVYI